MDLFLKFESEAQATELLYNITTEYEDKDGIRIATQTDAEGNVIVPEGATPVEIKTPKFVNLDIIGDIYKQTGVTEEIEGADGLKFSVPVMEKLDGYHVNIRLVNEDASELQQFSVLPSNPVRVWA